MTTSERNLSIGLLILRIGVAGYMATHGWGKLQMVLNNQYEMFGDPIGIGSKVSLLLVVFAEFVCAVLVLVGAGTRFAAIPVVITMAVAAFVAHGNDPWTMEGAAKLFFAGKTKMMLSKEPALIFMAGFLALFFTGAGRFSIDGLIGIRKAVAGSK